MSLFTGGAGFIGRSAVFFWPDFRDERVVPSAATSGQGSREVSSCCDTFGRPVHTVENTHLGVFCGASVAPCWRADALFLEIVEHAHGTPH